MLLDPKCIFIGIVALMFVFAARADDFILSYWCGPPPTEDFDKRYAEIAECNFTYTMLPCTGVSIEGNKKILEACKKHGLKYIVYDSRIFSFEASNPAFKTNLNAILADYSKHPATGGYFLGDEPAPDAFPRLGALNKYFLEQDPKHLPFVNLYPNYVPLGAIGGDYERYIEDFLTTVKPRLLSYDHYALLNDGSLRPIYFENMEIIRRQGLKHEVPIGFIFQVTPHGSYRDPSEAELRWQVNTALAYGAKALLHFTYWSPANVDPLFKNSDGIMDRKGNRSPHYERAKRINGAVKTWGPILMKLKSTAVYHTGKLPNATLRVPKDFFAQCKGEGEFVLGFFQHEDGSDWLMIVNRDFKQVAKTTLHFDKVIKGVRELSDKNGKLSSVKLRRNELSLELEAGAAKLFKLMPR